MSDERKELAEEIRLRVWTGAYEPEEIIETLGDYAVQIAASFFEPLGRDPKINCRWRKPNIFGRPEIGTREVFEKLPAFIQRRFQIRSVVICEDIENDVGRRVSFGQFLNATRSWVQTQL